jgi:ribosomal protein L40E
VEYTDAPQPEISAVDATTMPCPYCGHTLPKDATECDRCDWVRQGKPDSAEGKASDAFAVLLSIVPGLGHMYKGHTVLGLMILLIGTPMALGLAALIATGTAGFGLGLLPLYFIAVMFHVYGIEDRITPKDDEGEQY